MKLDALQIETIINKICPLIASESDYGYFKGILSIALENMNSAQASYFINKLLTAKGTKQ